MTLTTENMEALERSIKGAFAEFDCTAGALSSYADIKSSRFSRGMTREIPFTTQENEAILSVIAAMRGLQQSVEPQVPVNWAQIGKIKSIIDERRRQSKDELDPKILRPYFVRLSVLNFFQKLRSNGTPQETMNYPTEGAAFERHELAEEVVRRLKAMNVHSKVEQLTAPRRKSGMTTSLEELGFAAAQ